MNTGHGSGWLDRRAQGLVATAPAPQGWAAASWSGGKDGTLAVLAARAAGWDVGLLLTGVTPLGPHPLPRDWFEASAAVLGAQWRGFDPGADWGRAFDAELQRLQGEGCRAMVFGDIDLAAHREWLAPRCARAGLIGLWPLWNQPRAQVAQAVIDAGIEAIVLTVDAARLDPALCGRRYDARLLAELPTGVCPCGEDGEFHTAVVALAGQLRRADLRWHGVRCWTDGRGQRWARLDGLRLVQVPP